MAKKVNKMDLMITKKQKSLIKKYIDRYTRDILNDYLWDKYPDATLGGDN